MALPALALGLLLVAAAPDIKYKASARVESIVRTPLLTELANSPVVTDVLAAPRLEGFLNTHLLDVKLIYEPQFLIRQTTTRPTLEILQSVYTTGTYKIRRDLSLLAVHTTTYGTFPFDTNGGGGTGSLPVLPGAKVSSAYIYTETAAGFWTSLGIKRMAIAGTLGWVVNGLLDPPVRPARRGNAAYPQQRYPELRVQSFYGATRRDYLIVSLYGRDVSFSTGNRDSLLQLAPGLQHFFNPLVDLTVEPGLAFGREYPRRPDRPVENVLVPTLETRLQAPVPLGNHWPVRATVRMRYLPYMDPLTAQLVERGDVGVDLVWKGRREAKVTGKLRYARTLTPGIHSGDAEFKTEFEGLYPLPLSRYLYVQGKGQLTWTDHVVISSVPVVQWYTSVGLVVRYDRGRL
ncbi:hypothetical protein [Archangium sp.]|jgi:hypothetical protein|uniref:hypothetical protein n=1 Tax=Archangium sp. TaxID=1872627 RepID=UPI002ED81505